MNIPVDKTRLVCVDYPGIVQNVDMMLSTLGGERNISRVYNESNRRLELRWRPGDIYCKPACGDRLTTTRLLLRVRRRKRSQQDTTETCTGTEHRESEVAQGDAKISQGVITEQATASTVQSGDGKKMDEGEYEYDGKVMGVIDTKYTFQSLADLQYLPMISSDDGGYASIRQQVTLQKREPPSWLDISAPLFLPPPIFSRIDMPTEYAHRDGPKHSDKEQLDMPDANSTLGVERQRRPHYTLFAKFEDKVVPRQPIDKAEQKVKQKIRSHKELDELRQMFEKRPIWSKNAIKYHSSLRADQLKYMLPVVAYYFLNGPWRALWVRLGYNPRNDPRAKQYQLVDYRVRQRAAGEKMRIASKRSTYSYNLPNTVYRSNAQVPLIQRHAFSSEWKVDGSTLPTEKESVFRFRPGIIPAYRQMFYQFCDIEIPEIQQLLHQNDGQETECTDKDGWCISDMQEKARTILYRYVQEALKDDEISMQGKGKVGPKHKAKSSILVHAAKPEIHHSEQSMDESNPTPEEEEEDEEEEEETMDAGIDNGNEEEEDDNEMETEMLEYIAESL